MGSLWECLAFDAARSLEDAEELKAEEVGALAGNANEIGCAAPTDVELFLVLKGTTALPSRQKVATRCRSPLARGRVMTGP